MFKLTKNKNTKSKLVYGFTLVEVLVACSIISISMFALMETAQKGLNLSHQSLRKSQASLLLEEGAEVVKSIRDNGWDTKIKDLSLETPYHLFFNTTTKVWVLDTSTVNLAGSIPSYPIDGVFDRTVIVSAVKRDSNDDIVTSGGTLDLGTKKVIVTVIWVSKTGQNSKSLSFYMSNIF